MEAKVPARESGSMQGRLWFGFLGSAVAWFLHLAIVYGIAEAACPLGFPRVEILGVSDVEIVIIALTVVAVALCVVSGLVAYRTGVQLEQRDEAPDLIISRGAARHLTRGGVYLSILFIFIIVSQLFPVFFMRPCP